jgi:outer membrane protein assembly factor BamB
LDTALTAARKDGGMRARVSLAIGFAVVGVAAVARADDWPQFRGPNGSATSAERQVPVAWGSDKNVAWKTKVPGYGWSSPIVWADKVFVTTAITDKQRKPASGFFGPGPGGPGAPGGFGGGVPGGFRRPRVGQVLSPFLQEILSLKAEQKKQVEDLQKLVDDKLDAMLTPAQRQQLKEPSEGPGRGGFGSFAGFPQPGQVLPPSLQNRLKLTAEQKKQGEELQKTVDAKLDAIFTADQKKQFQDMRDAMGRGFGGGPGGFMGGRPPDAVYHFEIYCLDGASGRVLWKQPAFEGKPRIPTQASNTYATETPVTDGERVYAYFGMHGVYCYDLAGKLIWKVDLGSYPMAMGYGTGSSPALDEGRLFIQCDNEKQSFLVALDAKTGKELWRVKRPERTGFSTPFLWKNKLRSEVVCVGGSHIRSYDPSTGKQLWELGGTSGQPKATPVANADLLFVGTGGGFGGFGPGGRGAEPGTEPGNEPRGPRGGFGRGGSRPLFAVKAGASGDITLKAGAKSNDGVAWQLPQAGPQTASPLLYAANLYILDEHGGFLSCYDADTGKQRYKERLPGAKGFTSSPWICDGKVFCLDDAGTTYIVQAGPTFKVLGKNTVDAMCWSTPAVAGGALFVRTVDHLYCIKQQGEQK